MRKISFILAGFALLCSCEKIDSHYTYEEVVPGTTVKESQLGETISHQEFVNVTHDAYFAHLGSYPCVMDKGKVYYSNEIDNSPCYSGTWTVNVLNFQTDHAEFYEWSFGGNTDARLSYINYSYDENVLSGITLGQIADSKEYRVLYANDNYLIFETNGKTHNKYNNEGSEFSRVVYTRTTFSRIPEEVPEINDTIDLRI